MANNAIPITVNESILRPGDPHVDVPRATGLPGLIITVHGVNSTGEWYESAEHGLCAGLNERLARDQFLHPHKAAVLLPNGYAAELTEDGDLDDTVNPKNFISNPGYSPVIRFRWGYRAHPNELSRYESSVWLNRHDAWGGGPFANGTSCLQDLWGSGLNDRLFLGVTAQHLNPTSRLVYECPQRNYYVHACDRLARLVERIRKLHNGTPITIVCHSQGNMIGLGAAFIGAARNPDYVADTYILCNPPYSPEELFFYDFTNGKMGSRSVQSRLDTLKNFTDLIKARGEKSRQLQSLETINAEFRFEQEGRKRYELANEQNFDNGGFIDRDNRGKVFLYCCPHDQVIGASPVQGMGWRGLTAKELKHVDPGGQHFLLRVWAQGAKVGCKDRQSYHYWNDHWLTRKNGDKYEYPAEWWHPPSPRVKFRATYEKPDDSFFLIKPFIWIRNALGKGLAWIGTSVAEARIQGTPGHDHVVPVTAPPVREPLEPKSLRGGRMEGGIAHGEFDEGKDDAQAVRAGSDSTDRRGQRYEDKATDRLLQAQARRDGVQPGTNEWVAVVDKRRESLLTAAPENATDHGTIVGNPEHCRRVMAYDVAVGVCRLTQQEVAQLRIFADWRYVGESLESEYKDDSAFLEQVEDHALYYKQGGFGANGRTNVTEKYPESSRAALAPGIVDSAQKDLVYQDKGGK